MGKQKGISFKYPLIFEILGCIDLKASLGENWHWRIIMHYYIDRNKGYLYHSNDQHLYYTKVFLFVYEFMNYPNIATFVKVYFRSKDTCEADYTICGGSWLTFYYKPTKDVHLIYQRNLLNYEGLISKMGRNSIRIPKQKTKYKYKYMYIKV